MISVASQDISTALPTARCFLAVPTGKLRGACAATCSDATRWFGLQDVGLSENVGYIPNEIAIFHRDNDHYITIGKMGFSHIFRHTLCGHSNQNNMGMWQMLEATGTAQEALKFVRLLQQALQLQRLTETYAACCKI